MKHMRIQIVNEKNEFLKQYGKGLACSVIKFTEDGVNEQKESKIKIDPQYEKNFTFQGIFESKLKDQLDNLEEIICKQNRAKVMNSMADYFLENGFQKYAYDLYIMTQSKKANLMYKIIPSKTSF